MKFDLVDGDIGKVYDEVGKTVLSRSKKTKEHLVFEYYSRIMVALVSVLFPPKNIEINLDDRVRTVSYTENYPILGNDTDEGLVIEETPQEVPPSGPRF